MSKSEQAGILIFKKMDTINKEREESKKNREKPSCSYAINRHLKDARLFKEGKFETRPIAELLNE